MCRYGLDRLNFQPLDKFIVRAVNCYQRVWETGATTLPSFLTSQVFKSRNLFKAILENESISLRWKKRVAILLRMKRLGISRHFAKLGIIGHEANLPAWVGPYYAPQDVGQFIGFPHGPIPAILKFFGGHPLWMDDRVAGIIMCPELNLI
jgi:hypothetical protein